MTIWIGDRDFVGLATGKVSVAASFTREFNNKTHLRLLISSTLKSSTPLRFGSGSLRSLKGSQADVLHVYSASASVETSTRRSKWRSELSMASAARSCRRSRLGDLADLLYSSGSSRKNDRNLKGLLLVRKKMAVR